MFSVPCIFASLFFIHYTTEQTILQYIFIVLRYLCYISLYLQIKKHPDLKVWMCLAPYAELDTIRRNYRTALTLSYNSLQSITFFPVIPDFIMHAQKKRCSRALYAVNPAHRDIRKSFRRLPGRNLFCACFSSQDGEYLRPFHKQISGFACEQVNRIVGVSVADLQFGKACA